MGVIERIWHRATRADAAPAPEPVRRTSSTSRQPNIEDELTLTDDPPQEKRRRPGSVGIDPYSNDAGYAKPHSWERVDHD